MRLDPITLTASQGCYAKLTHSKYTKADLLYEFVVLTTRSAQQQVMPDDHSKVVPLLPIPNRTVKRLSADDSADSRVKVGHRQALIPPSAPVSHDTGAFGFVSYCFFGEKS